MLVPQQMFSSSQACHFIVQHDGIKRVTERTIKCNDRGIAKNSANLCDVCLGSRDQDEPIYL